MPGENNRALITSNQLIIRGDIRSVFATLVQSLFQLVCMIIQHPSHLIIPLKQSVSSSLTPCFPHTTSSVMAA